MRARRGRARCWRGVSAWSGLVLLALLVAACGSTASPTPRGSTSSSLPTALPATASVVPTSATTSAAPASAGASAGLTVVLTSPPPRPPAGLADPSTPAWQPSTGFTPDAVRVLTVTALQVSLAHYRAQHGAYPTTLIALFPADAPIGQDGQPMSGPPPASDGYRYAGGGSTYRLSVVLASGQTYVVGPPT